MRKRLAKNISRLSKTMMDQIGLMVLCTAAIFEIGSSFAPKSRVVSLDSRAFGANIPKEHSLLTLEVTKSSWSIEDDWSSLSLEHPENATPDTEDLFNLDLAASAALRMEGETKQNKSSNDDDEWLKDAVDHIQNHGLLSTSSDDSRLYDTGLESNTQRASFEDEMGQEISMLVNCNTMPEDMLVGEGRVQLPLTNEERNDPSQLAKKGNDGSIMPTVFFREAVSSMFHSHAKYHEASGQAVMDASSLANWMAKCLWEEENHVVSLHDKRVLSSIATYGTHGSGHLSEEEFQELYLRALETSMNLPIAAKTRGKEKLPTVETIFRDIRQHGIVLPVEFEREQVAAELREKYGSASAQEALLKTQHLDSLLDECEILEWEKAMNLEEEERKSSHELVELASDAKTPLRMRDGEFVFIDEESCIGCAQCVSVAPSSFVLLESGRARMFEQSRSPDVPLAVSVCPVNCMHNVAFHELKEMENARDHGDGRTDHRHMGRQRGHTPLSVAGIDSDANHKSSWYHYLKNKCNGSSECPQRGCFDCPSYAPGENPYFKALHRRAEHVRAKDLIANGSAEMWRKTAEL